MRSAVLLSVVLLAGCANLDSDQSATRVLGLADFSQPVDGGEPQTAVPPRIYGDAPMVEVRHGDLTGNEPAEPAKVPAKTGGSPPPPPPAPSTAQVDPTGTPHWMVDGLVGQINGRPVFAQDFLEPLAARLQELAAIPNRTQARAAMTQLLHERFDAFVNSELIISEAENQLTPEQQQGVFAWLRSLQEQEIAETGGTRAEASERLKEDLGMTIEEFMQMKRDQGMSRYLLDRKVEPRTIVSWRDVERFYRQNEAVINPPPLVRVGRISLRKDTQAAAMNTVQSMAAAGASFNEIAIAIGAPKDGQWISFPKPRDKTLAEAIDENKDVITDIKSRLRSLEPGRISEPIVDDTSMRWFAIIDVTDPPQQSIFDPALQLKIKDQLRGNRLAIEQSRYIQRLRSRWISDDIKEIQDRIDTIAFARYWK